MREHEPMHFSLTRDLDEFAALAEDFLAQSLERNLMATVLANARHVGATSTGPLLAYALTDDDEVCAAALRMPPWPLLVGDLPDAAADPLIEAWLALDPEVAAVNGPAASARAVASAWSRRTGGSSHRRMSEAMHVLERVRMPARHPPGALRLATPAELDLLTTWEREFSIEAGVGSGEQAERTVRVRIERAGQFVWDDGSPRSMLGLSPAIARTVRIGPVYTPPRHRCRGYASSAVAAAASGALEQGQAAACCSPISPTRRPTASTQRSDFAAWRTGRNTPSSPVDCARRPAARFEGGRGAVQHEAALWTYSSYSGLTYTATRFG